MWGGGASGGGGGKADGEGERGLEGVGCKEYGAQEWAEEMVRVRGDRGRGADGCCGERGAGLWRVGCAAREWGCAGGT